MYITAISFDPIRLVNNAVFWFFLVLFLVTWVMRVRRERAGQSWPTTTGIIEWTGVIDEDRQMRAEVRYSYNVNGEYYSGLHFRFVTRERAGERIIASFPKEMRILVHYKPDDPSIAVLDTEEIKARQRQQRAPQFEEIR
ncbi:MAG TPA: DUF3592 domain-containing protein [Terriglobales bacterium]|nr:DUF3592 domain-containing protein [Terriglobales bacterium]